MEAEAAPNGGPPPLTAEQEEDFEEIASDPFKVILDAINYDDKEDLSRRQEVQAAFAGEMILGVYMVETLGHDVEDVVETFIERSPVMTYNYDSEAEALTIQANWDDGAEPSEMVTYFSVSPMTYGMPVDVQVDD